MHGANQVRYVFGSTDSSLGFVSDEVAATAAIAPLGFLAGGLQGDGQGYAREIGEVSGGGYEGGYSGPIIVGRGRLTRCPVHDEPCDGETVTNNHLSKTTSEKRGFKELYPVVENLGRRMVDWKTIMDEEKTKVEANKGKGRQM